MESACKQTPNCGLNLTTVFQWKRNETAIQENETAFGKVIQEMLLKETIRELLESWTLERV